MKSYRVVFKEDDSEEVFEDYIEDKLVYSSEKNAQVFQLPTAKKNSEDPLLLQLLREDGTDATIPYTNIKYYESFLVDE